MSFEGKSQQEPRNWQMDRILIILKKGKQPKGFICPCTGVKYHNIQTCLLVYAADSGERLQDHWSSGCSVMTAESADHVFLPHSGQEGMFYCLYIFTVTLTHGTEWPPIGKIAAHSAYDVFMV